MIITASRESILFRNCLDADFEDLSASFSRLHCAKDEIVVKQGDPGKHFYVVESGLLSVYNGDRKVCKLLC